MWNAPATWSGITRARWGGLGEGGQLLEGSRGDDLPRAVDVGWGEAVTGQGVEHLLRIAADDRAHPGRCDGARVRHGPATDPHESQSVLGGEDAGGCRGRDLADGVTCRHPGRLCQRRRLVGEERLKGEQPGAHDEGLGDRGVGVGRWR